MENKDLEQIQVVFETPNQFRMLAPRSVAEGMVVLAQGNFDDDKLNSKHAAEMMDLVINKIPCTETTTTKGGKTTTVSYPAYTASFSDTMIKEIDAHYKALSVGKSHDLRMQRVKVALDSFKPTLSYGEAAYRVSYYLISNENNLAKSTNCLVSFIKKMLLNQANNMLVDSAILVGGQGKSTVQKGLLNAAEYFGFNAGMCHLPSISGGVQEAFVRNEVCVDDETTFHGVDLDSLNKVLDKSIVTIKGKYIKEWSAKSTANVFVGTNYLPTDLNIRRYSIRMVDENFKLFESFGRCGIPGKRADSFGDSYDKVVEWVTEGWKNLFWYCNNYDIQDLPFTEVGFDYGLQYRVKKAVNFAGDSKMTIAQVIKNMEGAEEDTFDSKTKASLKNSLYILASKMQLPKTVARKNVFSEYDWKLACDIDETDLANRDTLDEVYDFFHNADRFSLDCSN